MGGCTGKPSHSSRVTRTALSDQIMRIKLSSQLTQQKLERELKTKEDLLLEAFGSEPARRSKTIEKAMIGRTVYTRNTITIYKYIELEAMRLLDGKLQLDTWQTFNALTPSVNTLVFCSSFLNDEALQLFYALVKDKFPEYKFPGEADVRLELVRHHGKTEEVSFEMENTYIMEFCNKNNVELSRINEAGHEYRYAAGTVSYSQQL